MRCTEEDAEQDAESWVTRHTSWLHRMVERRVGALDCGEEVLQEVLMAASRGKVGQLPLQEQALWLSRVAIRQCALAWRSWTRRTRREGEYAEAFEQRVGDGAVDPIYGLMLDEERKMVREELDNIDSEHREILILKYVQGWSYRAIADHLGLSKSTVEYRLVLARRALRSRLLESGLDGGADHE